MYELTIEYIARLRKMATDRSASYLPTIRSTVSNMYYNHDNNLYVFTLRVRCKGHLIIDIKIDPKSNLEFHNFSDYYITNHKYQYHDRNEDLNEAIHEYFVDLRIKSLEMF